MQCDGADSLRATEYAHLNEVLYFDYAGAMPMCSSFSSKISELYKECYSNPHSSGQISIPGAHIEELRSALCHLFNTNVGEYEVIFTQNATKALQMFGNMISWTKDSNLFYLLDNHNSVLGLRALAEKHGSTAKCVTSCPDTIPDKTNFFVFPYQSNLCGERFPLDWVTQFQSKGGYVLLDAAACTVPDLSVHKPDFVAFSLLKLTGAHGGVLLVRRDRVDVIQDPIPAGGTVLFSCARSGKYKLLPILHQKFESGTPSYIDLSLALHGLKVRALIGTEKEINTRLTELTGYLFDSLKGLKHSNGKELVRFSHQWKPGFGPTVSLNFYDPSGQLMSHSDLSFMFQTFRISGRFGGHCNPGAGFPALGWDENEIEDIAAENEGRGRCISNLCELNGKAVGTVRLSLGPASVKRDIEKLIEILKQQLLNGGPCPPTKDLEAPMKVEKIFVFPVSGANGYEVDKWTVTPEGLLYDRRWRLIDVEGNICHTPKAFSLATLVPKIEGDSLVLHFPNESMSVPISDFAEDMTAPEVVRSQGKVYPRQVTDFLYRMMGKDWYLVKMPDEERVKMTFSSANVESLATVPKEYDAYRLRVNLLLSGASPFSEEGQMKKPMAFAGMPIKVWRWRIVCMTTSVDTATGVHDVKIMQEVLKKRGRNGALAFGNLWSVDCKEPKEFKIGDEITFI